MQFQEFQRRILLEYSNNRVSDEPGAILRD